MIGNIIIILIAVSIIIYVMKVYRSNLSNKNVYLWSAIVFSLILIISIIMPNIENIKSPLTPNADIIIIDAITKKPVQEAYIIIDWGYESSSLISHSTIGHSTHQKLKITDTKGMISIENRLKDLSIDFGPIYRRNNSGLSITILNEKYMSTTCPLTDGPSNVIYLSRQERPVDYDIERSNLLSIKGIAKRRYKSDISKSVESFVDIKLNKMNASKVGI